MIYHLEAFEQMNIELENLYFEASDRSHVIGIGGPINAALRDEGHKDDLAALRTALIAGQ